MNGGHLRLLARLLLLGILFDISVKGAGSAPVAAPSAPVAAPSAPMAAPSAPFPAHPNSPSDTDHTFASRTDKNPPHSCAELDTLLTYSR